MPEQLDASVDDYGHPPVAAPYGPGDPLLSGRVLGAGPTATAADRMGRGSMAPFDHRPRTAATRPLLFSASRR